MNQSPYAVLNEYGWLDERYNTKRLSDVEIATEVSALYGETCHRVTVARARARLGIAGRGRGRIPKPSRFSDKAWLTEEVRTKTYSQIGIENDCSTAHVSSWVKRHGLSHSSKSEAVRAGLRKHYGPDGRRGTKASNWKGGRPKRGDYWWLHRELVVERWPNHPRLALDGWSHKQEHILVMENYVGRVLQPGEDVHHGPGGKEDNRIENLTLTGSRGEHIAGHWADAKEAAQLRVKNERLRERIAYLEGLLDEHYIPYGGPA